MIYHITLVNDLGFYQEALLELATTPEISWLDFQGLSQVQALLALHPTYQLLDVTPAGMPDQFTDQQDLDNNKVNNPSKSKSKDLFDDFEL